MFLLVLLGLHYFASSALCYNPNEYNEWVPGHHGYHGVHNGLEHAEHFVNEWTVAVDGGEEIAQLVALELGYKYAGMVSLFLHCYDGLVKPACKL
jgi:hypothetical protein